MAIETLGDGALLPEDYNQQINGAIQHLVDENGKALVDAYGNWIQIIR